MLDDLKNKIKDAAADITSGQSANASGTWIDGKFVPNAQMDQPVQEQMYQQPMQQQMYQQLQQPMQQQMYQQPQQPIQQQMYQQPQQPMQQMYQQPQQPMQQMYQQPQQPMQQQMYQQPQQPMQQQMYQQPQQPMQQQMYQQPQQQVSAGGWVNGKWVSAGGEQQTSKSKGLTCPKCKSDNISVQLIEVGSTTKTKKSGVGLGGHTHNAVRAGMAFATLGASNLVIKKATGTEKGKTKTKTQTYCICQNCGNSWKK